MTGHWQGRVKPMLITEAERQGQDLRFTSSRKISASNGAITRTQTHATERSSNAISFAEALFSYALRPAISFIWGFCQLVKESVQVRFAPGYAFAELNGGNDYRKDHRYG